MNFTIGEDFGNLITDLAKEKISEEYDIEKAIKVILDSLIGIKEESAIKLIFGKAVLTVDVKTQEVIFTEIDVPHNIYTLNKIEEKISFIEEDARVLHDTFSSNLQSISTTIDFSFSAFKSFLIRDDITDMEKEIEEEYNDIKHLYNLIDKFILKSLRLITMYNKANELSIKYNLDLKIPEKALKIPDEIYALQYLAKGNITEETNKQLDNYLESQMEIDEIAEVGIKPVSILDNYSAGYIAPNGDYYGLNGEIANMLHIQLADMMIEANIIPEDFDNNNIISADSWLDRNGWVKQHGNWILFDGYNNYKSDIEEIPLSEEQRKAIYEFGSLCHNGVLTAGFRKEPITATKFKLFDDIHFKTKIFNY